MGTILNITNGDSAVTLMKEANIPGDFLPWRDVLHDGPVPAGLSLEKLSQIRSKFISEHGWGKVNNIKQSFIDRDNVLKSFQQYDKVILWFEHDLYDQLQILQIVDWFYLNATENSNLSIICTDPAKSGVVRKNENKRTIENNRFIVCLPVEVVVVCSSCL